ncbi:hypothetical protein KCK05_004697 [Salmonella enterica]|nr:hypothetical protein [Salmonella enterica]EHK1997770.1 hypothetical protein [Salmonella enterica]EHN5165782.1 hypothetical protein [Salmonella enterica]
MNTNSGCLNKCILKQGFQLGISAKLASKLNYLCRSCTGELTEQNDLFRLTCALEQRKICTGTTVC